MIIYGTWLDNKVFHCPCNRELSEILYMTFKLKSVILENEPEIIICEQCLFEKLLNKKININQDRFKKGIKYQNKPWWKFW